MDDGLEPRAVASDLQDNTWIQRHLQSAGWAPAAIQRRLTAAMVAASRQQPPTHRAGADVAHLAALCQEALRP